MPKRQPALGELEVRVRIAVTGATGRIGGQVVELLAAAEEHQVVALSRRPPDAARHRHQSPLVVEATADYAHLPALRAALRDVDTLVFVSSDGEATNVLHHHQCVIRAATDSGVTHIVALSGLDADLSSPFCYAVTYGHTERLLAGSDCRVSIARASIYTEFFLGFLTRAGGRELRLPAADRRISLVSRTDVARCLAALAVAAPTGRHHDITGPESLDLAAVAALAEDVWRMPLRYVDVTQVEQIVELARDGLEPWWVYAYATMFASIREQRWASVSGEVRELVPLDHQDAGSVVRQCPGSQQAAHAPTEYQCLLHDPTSALSVGRSEYRRTAGMPAWPGWHGS